MSTATLVEAPWTVEEVDQQLAVCASQLRSLTNYKARVLVMGRADRLLERRHMLVRCERSGVVLAKR